ncbi:MAG: hypothetical protein ACREKH_03265, partial [Candidatus Rokuibacteriota bacterium]
MRKLAVAALVLVATALLRPGIVDATTEANVCEDSMADPCELTKEITVDPDSTLDFGNRAFVIKAPDGRLQIPTGGRLSITAGSMVVETGPGGRLRSAPGSRGDSSVKIRVTGTFATAKAAGVAAVAIDLPSPGDTDGAPCSLDIAADGDVTIGAEIRAQGTVNQNGGDVFITTAGRMTVSDRILVDSPLAGGMVDLVATGPIEVTAGGEIDASDAYGEGNIAVTTDADLVNTGQLKTQARLGGGDEDRFCYGGFMSLSALGDIVVNGRISGNGEFEGCTGSTLNMLARGSILVNAPIDLSGGPTGEGGFLLDVQAGRDFLQEAPILVSSGGQYGYGGEVDIFAGRRLLIGALLDLSGGLQIDPEGDRGRGGELVATAAHTLEIAGEVAADGADFGSVTFNSTREAPDELPGRILVTGQVHARASADEDSSADVSFEACDIEIAPSGRIEKAGPASRNLLRASNTMKIAGALVAGSGTNELHHRDLAKPPLIAATALVSPAPIVTATPAELPPCACTVDPNAAGVLCDDGNACTT